MKIKTTKDIMLYHNKEISRIIANSEYIFNKEIHRLILDQDRKID